MSPDRSAKAEPVPYAKLDDPQSLNLYSYVGNNPLRNVDADGHDLTVDPALQALVDIYTQPTPGHQKEAVERASQLVTDGDELGAFRGSLHTGS